MREAVDPDADVSEVARELAASLAPAYRDVMSVAALEQLVAESFAELAGRARVTDFLALLTERAVTERLRIALQPAPAPAPAPRLRVIPL